MSSLAPRLAQMSPLQIALAAQRARPQLELAMAEPIAVLGMGCRFPPDARSPEELWQLLRDGTDAVSPVPAERWDVEAFYDPDPRAPGKMYCRHGSFLRGVDQFDPQFFGISPREASRMDPQQRLLLEVSWEALEHAGIAPDRLDGSSAGVFVGVMNEDYSHRMVAREADVHTAAGTKVSIMAGRLAHFFGLQGPAMVVDTACSSSLVAVHLACQSLRTRECDLALAGGVNLTLSPLTSIVACATRMLSPDGLCKVFDRRADGFGRGEGCGMIALKRLSDAVADRDDVLCLIRGSAVSHDGRSSALTVPNGSSQVKVIRRALASAALTPGQVGYVEAHGTGTALGDPIELEALGRVFGKDREAGEPLRVGSVKTNFGHTEGAAGIAGLMKVALSLQHGEIPPHLHLREPNPQVLWDELPVAVVTELFPWPAGTRRRIAGVSSFGLSGTNAHAVLEEAPAGPASDPPAADRPVHLLTLSAKTAPALAELAGRVAATLEGPALNGATLGDVCWSANTGRSHLRQRLALRARSPREASERLRAFQRAGRGEGVRRAAVPRNRPKIAFLFTGQGAQHPGMGEALYRSEPVFRETLERCDEIARPHLGGSLISALYPEDRAQPSRLDETAWAQPALFAFEVALAELWRHWGITASILLGHSLGEYVAACVAGVFSLEEGLPLVVERARLMQTMPSDGAMATVFASEERVRAAVAGSEVSLAARNAPRSNVISGSAARVDEVLAALRREGIDGKRLRVSRAFHSPQVEPIAAALRAAADRVSHRPPQIPIVSNVHGTLAGAELYGGDYWREHLRAPVLFGAGLETARAHASTFLEVGPRPVLLALGREGGEEVSGGATWLASLRPGRDDHDQLLDSLGALYAAGAPVAWERMDRHPRKRVVLPTYPFQRRSYWLESAADTAPGAPSPPAGDELLQGDVDRLAEKLAIIEGLSSSQVQALTASLSGKDDSQGSDAP